jgi:NADPH-dependent 2,4-dienoyl-CoA reductase/sulfur reductase-like enzyme
MIDTPTTSKKVAVIGGGPAGMEAAIVAAQRGHKVTLYEKNYFLGGQLRHADYASFKWPLRDFKDYLIRQVAKAGVEVLLSTEATPEMIKAGGYDAIMAATGAAPNIPDIPGAHGKNIWMPIDVYGHEKELGENVVVVGGSEIGVETGMYLAENGHKVTLLTRQKELATDATAIHYIEPFTEAWEALPTFSFVLEATTTAISKDKVTYTDAKGKEKSIKADSVVISGGMNPRQEEALKFYGTANQFFLIGDCDSGGSVLKCMRSAFSTASLL